MFPTQELTLAWGSILFHFYARARDYLKYYFQTPDTLAIVLTHPSTAVGRLGREKGDLEGPYRIHSATESSKPKSPALGSRKHHFGTPQFKSLSQNQ